MQARVALTLRMVAGLTVPEIARAFLVQETTMGQRITRAKAKITAARIPYRVPSAQDLPARVSGVLAVLYLVFNEGYLATGPDTDPVRADLTAEAIRLTRLVHALIPEGGEAAGLLALMLLTDARRTARVSATGELVTLAEQDRAAWDATLLAEGHRLVREALAADMAPGRYQILTAINAVHTSARDARDTDWSQVLALYDQLVHLDPSRSSPSTAPSRSPSSTAPTWPWQPSTVSSTPWPATTPTTQPEPTCSAGSAAASTPRRIRHSHQPRRQHRRDRLPDPPPQPTGIAPEDGGGNTQAPGRWRSGSTPESAAGRARICRDGRI